MTRELLDSFWRAAASSLHPRVVALSLVPLAIVGGAVAVLGNYLLAALEQLRGRERARGTSPSAPTRSLDGPRGFAA